MPRKSKSKSQIMKKLHGAEIAKKACPNTSSACLSDTESKPAVQGKTSPLKTYADVVKGNIGSSSATIDGSGNNVGQIPATSCAVEGRLPVQASYHQADSQRFGIYAGIQCVANSFNAVVKSTTKSILTWGTEDINTVLENGNTLYYDLRRKNKINDKGGYMLVTELPDIYRLEHDAFSLSLGDPILGKFGVFDYNDTQDFLKPLDMALQLVFVDFNACLVTMNGATCTVIRDGNWFAIFDPHARNKRGQVDGDGKAVVVYHKDISDVLQHFEELATSLGMHCGQVFEITGVKIEMLNHTEGSTAPMLCPQTQDDDEDVTAKAMMEEAMVYETEPPKDIGPLKETYDDVTVVGHKEPNLVFLPLTRQQRKESCAKLKIENQTVSEDRNSYSPMGEPCDTKSIKGDGNCFFRATSFSICGNENQHNKTRKMVVSHLKQNALKFTPYLRNEYSSMDDYLASSRMKYVGSWATELEIIATADLFNIDIYTHNEDRWNLYTCEQHVRHVPSNCGAVYLKHCNRNHYEVVTCVKHKNNSAICLGICKVANDGLQYKTRLRHAQEDTRSEKIKRKYEMNNEEELEKKRKMYHANPDQREQKLGQMREQYHANPDQREQKLGQKREQYHANPDQRKQKLRRQKEQYDTNPDHQKKKIETRKQKYASNIENNKNIVNAIQNFNNTVANNLAYVCCVCHRLLFRNQVVQCKVESYGKTSEIAALASKCITTTYLHVSNEECGVQCNLCRRERDKLWICHTCHGKLRNGKMPEGSTVNGLHLEPIPLELKCLNSLEEHLVALNIPFMKLVPLPKGGQNGVHGPVVCVPSNINDITSILPRDEQRNLIIKVKLKRKLSYKGHYQYQFVTTEHVKIALDYLIKNNKWYADIEVNDQWINPLEKIEEVEEEFGEVEEEFGEVEDEPIEDVLQNNNLDDSRVHDDNEVDEVEEDLTYTEQQQGIFLDTCLQPVDIGQEILDHHFDDVFCLAPAEGSNPVQLLKDLSNEAKCFPSLYPIGGPTFCDERPIRITLANYLKHRILNADGRFAKNTDYIFYSQYISELEQILSNVSIALRKGSSNTNRNVTANMLTNKESLQEILKFDEGYKFLRPVRGTPPFWQSVQKDLFAMLRQLGIPTWFCSFSCAEMRWTEILKTIMTQEGIKKNVNEMDWLEKNDLLKRNPVTAARMFDHRFQTFLNKVIFSDANPIGKIKDYFYRIEFQHRGSPHAHCLFWVENAPQIGKDEDEDVVQFVDRYITCKRPSNDSDLEEKVTSVQKHSKRHSKTCRKKGTTCRFNFPREPTCRTFICRNKTNDQKKNSSDASNMNKGMPEEQAMKILTKLKLALSNDDVESFTTEELFEKIGISQRDLENAHASLSGKTSIVHKREPDALWINQYNENLLRAWNANMDIQFVIDAYSCVVYIISYISKAEREMGLLLERTQKEARNQENHDARRALKELGAVYLHNREVCAQEAVYRLTGMLLRKCSRKVQFIPTGENPVKMSKPLHVLQQQTQEGTISDKELWMVSLSDRYRNRPNTENFENMCLASFGSEYRVLSKSEVNPSKVKNDGNIVKLNKDFGYVRRRTATQPAVVRYARLSPTKDPEKYHQSILQLFLPHRNDSDLKPPPFESYEDYFNLGTIHIDGNDHSVKSIVDENRCLFEKESEKIDEVKEMIETFGELEDVWAQICPESELDRLECQEILQNRKQDLLEEGNVEMIPDLMINHDVAVVVEKNRCEMSRDEALNLLRSLNDLQRKAFYQIRQWCLAKYHGDNPDPFYLFVTGSAGTGKSHLIKAIQYECSRILQQTTANPDDVTVLLTAPTGVAAYNIGAATIHSTFRINAHSKLPYQPLGEEQINTLRTKLSNLKILIIDEISMVDHTLLSYIHGRLRQIKQTGDYSPFGKVSIIAVGDFYQLPPCRSRPLYDQSHLVDLWTDNFTVLELQEIVRQKDASFAELLNRIRKQKKGEPLLKADVQMLKQRETGEKQNVIHIFATNAEVDQYNAEMLSKTCNDIMEIKAQDFERNAKTGRLEKKIGYHSKVFNTCLKKSLSLAIGARVMLVKNICVSDGLTNGAFGTVAYIDSDLDECFPKTIYIVFDDPKIGQNQRSKVFCRPCIPQNATPIKPEEDQINNRGGKRRQFPLRLAYSCTVHKMQGLTVDNAVVSLKKIFTTGQAYVALSRVRSIEGLIIEDFKESAIYCNDKIQDAMSNMPQFIEEEDNPAPLHQSFKMVLHNIQSLKAHIKDLIADDRVIDANCVFLTETWLHADENTDPLQIPGFVLHHRPRFSSYDNSNNMFSQLKQQSSGGVGAYCRANVKTEVSYPLCNIECLLLKFPENNLNVAVLYRPGTYPVSVFKKNLTHLINDLEMENGGKIIMGDFNDNILTSSSIPNMMSKYGYRQHVLNVTTEDGTLIDHIYMKSVQNVNVAVIPTYYSFHNAISLTLFE